MFTKALYILPLFRVHLYLGDACAGPGRECPLNGGFTVWITKAQNGTYHLVAWTVIRRTKY